MKPWQRAFSGPWIKFLFCLSLALTTLAVYFPVQDHEFIGLDDAWYVTDNYHVRSGLTLENLRWAFKLRHEKASHWHPLTWMSHMLDCTLFGLDPGRHHLVSVCIHVLTVVTVFLVLYSATGAFGKSLAVAALFALHPLSVNSVAWLAERKNVLCAFFWALTLLAYCGYVKRPSFFRYCSALFLFVLGLMAKPMIITLPFTLLLFDIWPCERLRGQGPKRFVALAGEKIPFFLLMILFLFLYNNAFVPDSLVSFAQIPLRLRIENGLVSYVRYIVLIFFPHGLAVYYPYPPVIPFWQALLAAVFVVLVSAVVLFRAKALPFLLTGWLWYLGTLVPAIGLKQVGLWPAQADRFVYVPMLGILIALVWGGAALVTGQRFRQIAGIAALAVFLGFLTLGTVAHLKTWQNSTALYENNLKVTENNYIVHSNYALALQKAGKTDEAIFHCREALRINPNFVKARNNLGKLFLDRGQLAAAAEQFFRVLQQDPDNAKAHNNLGTVLARTGQKEEAIDHFKNAVESHPLFSNALVNLCGAYIETGDLKNAFTFCQKAITLKPDVARGYYYLGLIWAKLGQTDRAVVCYRQALVLAPKMANAHTDLAIALVAENRLASAIDHFKKAVVLNPESVTAHYNFGMACFKAKRYAAARNIFQNVLRMDPRHRPAEEKLRAVLEVMQGMTEESASQKK